MSVIAAVWYEGPLAVRGVASLLGVGFSHPLEARLAEGERRVLPEAGVLFLPVVLSSAGRCVGAL